MKDIPFRLEAIALRLEAIAMLGWWPSLLGWRPSLLGWRPSIALRLEAALWLGPRSFSHCPLFWARSSPSVSLEAAEGAHVLVPARCGGPRPIRGRALQGVEVLPVSVRRKKPAATGVGRSVRTGRSERERRTVRDAPFVPNVASSCYTGSYR